MKKVIVSNESCEITIVPAKDPDGTLIVLIGMVYYPDTRSNEYIYFKSDSDFDNFITNFIKSSF